MNIYDFWTFRKNAYIIHFFFHMLFGAFHITPVKQSISEWRFDQVFGAYLCRCNFNRLTLFEYYDNWLSSVRMSTVEKWKLKELIITRNWIGNTGGGNFFIRKSLWKMTSSRGQFRFFIRIQKKLVFWLFPHSRDKIAFLSWFSVFLSVFSHGTENLRFESESG